mgnify:CR=1 FL=1
MGGSPPLNWMTSGLPSISTKRSSIPSTCRMVRLKPIPALAKQTGQLRLQAVLTSIRARHRCCLCSGQRPQSRGQPSFTSVLNSRGRVPGLLNLTESTYIWASELMMPSNQPWSGHRLRMKTLLSRMITWASMTNLHCGQMLLVSS